MMSLCSFLLLLTLHLLVVLLPPQALVMSAASSSVTHPATTQSSNREMDALPSTFVPTMRVCGNYCGPGWCGGTYVQEGPQCPFDQLPTDCNDACCKVHDQCCREDALEHKGCDQALVQCITDCAPSFDPGGEDPDPGPYAPGPGTKCDEMTSNWVRRVMQSAINLDVGQCGGFATATVTDAPPGAHTHGAGAMPLTAGGYHAWQIMGKGVLSYMFAFTQTTSWSVLTNTGTVALVNRDNFEHMARNEPYNAAAPDLCCDSRNVKSTVYEQGVGIDPCELSGDGTCEVFVVARCDNSYTECAGRYSFDFLADKVGEGGLREVRAQV